jgi:hypothetical protein
MNEALCNVIKRLHYPLEVILTCVRWCAAYPLNLRHIEEMSGLYRRQGKALTNSPTRCQLSNPISLSS